MSSPTSSTSPPPQGGGAPGAGGAAGPPVPPGYAAYAAAAAAEMARDQVQDERAGWHFAIAVAGLVFFFTLVNWTRFLYSRHASNGLKSSSLMRSQVKITRFFRGLLIRKVPGFTSFGHAVLVALYLAINIIVTVTHTDWSNLVEIGKRCGWMALLNIAFITFLALRNSPLAFLTDYSYERLNQLHQVGGYMTAAYVFVHLTLISKGLVSFELATILYQVPQIHGMIAASAMFVTLIAAVVIRRLRYEAFYVIHVVMYMLIIINVALHRPEHAWKAFIVTAIAGSMWSCDRIIRACRVIWYSFGNTATLTPLAHVSAYDGFTNDLHQYAKKHPGATIRASVEGPYGTVPDLANSVDKVVFIAGGSGATYTFGMARELLKNLGNSTKTRIEFIWAVKEHNALSWFADELAELQSSPLVNLQLYTTRPSSVARGDDTPPTTTVDHEKPGPNLNLDLDIEKHPSKLTPSSSTPESTTPWDSTTSLPILHGRPDVQALVTEIVASAKDTDRIAIAACGPDGLMRDTRKAAVGVIKMNGPSIEFYAEQFGW